MQKKEIKKYDKIKKYVRIFFVLFFAFIFIITLTKTNNSYYNFRFFITIIAAFFIFFEVAAFVVAFIVSCFDININKNRVKDQLTRIFSFIVFLLVVAVVIFCSILFFHSLFAIPLFLLFYWILRIFVPSFKIRIIFCLFLLVWSFLLRGYHIEPFYRITGNIVKKEFTKELSVPKSTNSADLACEEEAPDNCKFIKTESFNKATKGWNIICIYGCPK